MTVTAADSIALGLVSGERKPSIAVTLKCAQSARHSTGHERAAWYWIALVDGPLAPQRAILAV